MPHYSLKLEGFEEIEAILQGGANLDLKGVTAVVFNECDHAGLLEYGSAPGHDPWGAPGNKTIMVVDIYTGEQRIVSKQGFAMVRGSEEATLKKLDELLSQIDLKGNIEEQVKNAINEAGAFWLEKAKETTPVDTGEAQESWELKEAR